MPLVAVQVIIFDLIVYLCVSQSRYGIDCTDLRSMANLSRTPSQFFINLLILFVLTMTIYSFFRAIGALCSSLDVGMLHDNVRTLYRLTNYSHSNYRSCLASSNRLHRYVLVFLAF